MVSSLLLSGGLLIFAGLSFCVLLMDLPLTLSFRGKCEENKEGLDMEAGFGGRKVSYCGTFYGMGRYSSGTTPMGNGKKPASRIFMQISKYFSGILPSSTQRSSRAKVEQLLFRSGLRIRYREYLLLSGGGLVLGILIGQYLNNWFISILAAYLGCQIPRKCLEIFKNRRRQILSRQLEPALQQISNLYQITRSLETACEQAVTALPTPLKEEFLRMLSDIKVAGMTLEEALIRLAGRLDLKDFDFFVKIALLAQNYGGETKELMLQIPQTIRERQMIRAELETEVAGAKQQAWILLAGTPLFFIVYKVLRPDFALILTGTTPGKIGMAVVALLSILSVLLIEKITEPLS